jgi:hypothetical protein
MNRDHRFAADRAMGDVEAGQRDRFLELVPDPALRRALARDPVLLSRLERLVAASAFVNDPDAAAHHAHALAQALLDAAGRFAGSLGGATAGRASGAARKADAAQRDELIQGLWAATDPGLNDSARADTVQKRLWRQHGIELSTRQILRIVRPKKKP